GACNPLDSFNHFLEDRFVLEVHHLAGNILKFVGRQVDPLVHDQQQIATIGGSYLLDFAPQVVGMPETYQFDQHALACLFMGDGKIRNHDSIAEQQYFVFAREQPLAALTAELGLELGGKI